MAVSLFFQATPQLSYQWSGHVNRYGCCLWARQHGFSFAKADLAAAAECPTCQHVNHRDQSWALDMAAFPRRTSQPPGGKLITLDSFHHWGGSNFFSPWNRRIIWIWVCLSHQRCFCQHHHLWTYWMHYSLSWYHTKYFYSDQGILFCSQNNK